MAPPLPHNSLGGHWLCQGWCGMGGWRGSGRGLAAGRPGLALPAAHEAQAQARPTAQV